MAITRHGATIGIYVPTRPKPTEVDLEALRLAGERVQQAIEAAGTNEEELVADFERARKPARAHKN